jgi:hypothetical protein
LWCVCTTLWFAWFSCVVGFVAFVSIGTATGITMIGFATLAVLEYICGVFVLWTYFASALRSIVGLMGWNVSRQANERGGPDMDILYIQ